MSYPRVSHSWFDFTKTRGIIRFRGGIVYRPIVRVVFDHRLAISHNPSQPFSLCVYADSDHVYTPHTTGSYHTAVMVTKRGGCFAVKTDLPAEYRDFSFVRVRHHAHRLTCGRIRREIDDVHLYYTDVHVSFVYVLHSDGSRRRPSFMTSSDNALLYDLKAHYADGSLRGRPGR